MLPTDDPEALQLITEYRNARRSVRIGGILSVAAGLFALVAGFNYGNNVQGIVVLVIGMLLVACGLFSAIVNNEWGFMTNHAALALSGVFFALLMFWPPEPQNLWPPFGFLLIVGGVFVLCKHPKSPEVFLRGVTRDQSAKLDDVAECISKSDGEQDNRIIDFVVTTRGGQYGNWRGQLLADMVLFVDPAPIWREVVVVRKADISIEPHRKALLGTSLIAAITIRGRRWQVKISPRSFERYRAWNWAEAEREVRRRFSANPDGSQEGAPLLPDADHEGLSGIQHQGPASNDGDVTPFPIER